MEKSDVEILNAMRGGNFVAFRELYGRYSDLIYRNILVRVNSSFDADDIFQDFFTKLWEKRASFDEVNNVRAYIMVALKNHILNTIKERQIRDKHHGLSQAGFEETDDYTWVKIVAEDLDERIKDVVNTLPSRLREVWILSREQHLTVKEISERLSVSEQTIKNQLTDILKRLKNEINKKNFVF